MRTRLVVNADDLGLHPEIDAGILRAHHEGIVTSATLLVSGPNAAEAVRAARERGLSIGVHLALSTGLAPAALPEEVPRLAPGGRFRPSWRAFARAWLLGEIAPSEVALELEAQLARARSLGFQPDHLDTHQHLHLLPGVREIVEGLAYREGLPLRWPVQWPGQRTWRRHPAGAAKAALLWALGRFSVANGHQGPRRVPGLGVAEAGALTEPALLSLIDALPEGELELGCHPGAGRPFIPEDPGWRYAWEQECAALCSPAVRERLAARGVELVSYRQLRATRA